MILASCKENNVVLEPEYKNYFPSDKNFYNVYFFDSTYYSDVDTNQKKTTYYIKEEIDSTFVDAENNVNYFIKASKRKNFSDVWKIKETYFIESNNFYVLKQQNGLGIFILKFPPYINFKWQSNSRLGSKDEKVFFVYEKTNSNFSYDTLKFDSCIEVLEEFVENKIDTVIKKTVYSFGKGLVYQKEKRVSKQPSKPKSGFESTKVLLYRNKK